MPFERIRDAVLQRLENAQLAGIEQIPHALLPKTPLDSLNIQADEPQTTAAEALSSSPKPQTISASGPPKVQGEPSHEPNLRELEPTSPKETPVPLPSEKTTTKRPAVELNAKKNPLLAESAFDSPSAECSASSRSLKILNDHVRDCTLCPELASTRTQTVFGVGNPKADLVFLGEAPGADEDKQGIPFVGRAGKLLTEMVENGMKINRDELYICNILRCRPPSNRNPTPNESNNCRGFLLRQLELIKPKFICCLGAVAAQNLLDTDTPIGKLRGEVHMWNGIRVICTYHPAYLLRNPSAKGKTWEDLKLLMKEMGI